MCNSLLSLVLLFSAAMADAAESNCSVSETVIFSCAVGKGKKVVSLCATPRFTAKSGALYYRFGAPANTELAYPSSPNLAAQKFRYAHYSRPLTERQELTFDIGSTNYAVFDYYEEGEKPQHVRGVRVSTAEEKFQETILGCKGAVTSHLEQLEEKVPCDAESALAQCKRASIFGSPAAH